MIAAGPRAKERNCSAIAITDNDRRKHRVLNSKARADVVRLAPGHAAIVAIRNESMIVRIWRRRSGARGWCRRRHRSGPRHINSVRSSGTRRRSFADADRRIIAAALAFRDRAHGPGRACVS